MLRAPSRSVGALATGGAVTWVRPSPPPSPPQPASTSAATPAPPSPRNRRRSTRIRSSSAIWSHPFVAAGPVPPGATVVPAVRSAAPLGHPLRDRLLGGGGRDQARLGATEQVHPLRLPGAPDLLPDAEPGRAGPRLAADHLLPAAQAHHLLDDLAA